jgi:hypothetical protein
VTCAPQSSPALRRLPACLLLLFAVTTRGAAQERAGARSGAATPKPSAQPAAKHAPPAASPPSVAPAPASDAGADRVEVGRAAPLYTVPDGGPFATLQPGASGRVVARSGDWVRVQVEGWVRDADLKRAAGGALAGVTAAEVRANPDKYVGQAVEWRLQLIAIQTADELRPEITPGEPYLLTRGPLPEPGFVYVVVPRDMLPRFQSLGPLAELTVRGTITAARSKYLATPVIRLDTLLEPAVGTR